MRFGLGVVIAGGLVFAACSSGGDAEPDESRPPPTAATAASTTDAPQPTDPATTVAASTTDLAPPTTEQSFDDLIAEIEADLNEGEQAVLAAAADPSDPQLRADIDRFNVGAARDQVIEFLDRLAADGLRMRPGVDVANTVDVLGFEDVTTSAATVEVCRVDAAVIYKPTAGGGESIVNDAIETSHSRTKIVLVDGVWAVADGERISVTDGVASCVGA